MILFVAFLLHCGLTSAQTDRPDKRVSESAPSQSRGRSPFGGGGIYRKGDFDKIERDSGDSLLQVDDHSDASGGEIPEKYLYLENYPSCHRIEIQGQGDCNSCWAFATQNMVRARMCKWGVDKNFTSYPVQGPEPSIGFNRLSPAKGAPFPMVSSSTLICSVLGPDVCEPRSISDALEFMDHQGLRVTNHKITFSSILGSSQKAESTAPTPPEYNEALLKLTGGQPILKERFGKAIYLHGDPYEVNSRMHADISMPSEKFCDETKAVIVPYKVFAKPMIVGYDDEAPSTAVLNKKKSIMLGGPIIGMIRLTAEFLENYDHIFDPADYHFCTIGESKCDKTPETKRKALKPPNMSMDDYRDTWYNHFIVLHGWGKMEGTGEPYWVVENSWGPIYQYRSASEVQRLVGSVSGWLGDTVRLSDFVIIYDKDAGRGKLEITSRPAFGARQFVTTYSKESR